MERREERERGERKRRWEGRVSTEARGPNGELDCGWAPDRFFFSSDFFSKLSYRVTFLISRESTHISAFNKVGVA